MLRILPGRVDGRVTAPASKSDAQRALAAASLARGRSVISACTPCDDTDAALDVIGALGAFSAFDFDAADAPDLVPALVALA